MKPTLLTLLSLSLCLPWVHAQDNATRAESEDASNQPVEQLTPHPPESTSSADALLPSTETEAEKIAQEKKTVEDSTSTAGQALPGKQDFVDPVSTAIAEDDAQAEGSEGTPPAAGAATSGSTSPTEKATADLVPVESFAPDTSGLSVKEVQVEEPAFEATLDPSGQPAMSETQQDLPALEIDFPDSGEVTMEFPTDEAGQFDMAMGQDDSISVDFPDEEVRTIVRNVADLYDLNVVIPDTLVGSTSVKLRNVSWRQVFEVVLEPLGFTYIEDRNIIKIRSRDELLQEPTDTRVFLINYAVAKNLQSSLAPLVDAASGGRIQVDDRTNALIITERPSRMNDIQEIIERLDRPNAQVMIESKFIEVNDRDQRNLGINWTSLNAYRVSAGPFQRDYARNASSNDNNLSNNTNFGDTNSTSSVVNGVPTNTFTNAAGTTFNNAVDVATAAATSRIDTAVFSADAFSWVLSALETIGDSKLLTNPTLVTLDGEDAKLLIGDKYPVPSYTYNEERGTFEVSGFTYEDIGIVLTVRPQVNAAGFIRLDVNPVLSRRNGEVNFGGAGGATIPIINSTETESSVILKDGYTLAIGGLIQNERIDGESKVPFFGDIPGLGYFFKSTSKDTQERNLIIFITARTLNPDGTTYKDIIDPRMLYKMGITEADIPGLPLPDEQAQAMEQIFQMRSKVEHDVNQVDMMQNLTNLEKATATKTDESASESDTSSSSSSSSRPVSRARGF